MKHKLCTISIFCPCLFGCGNSSIAIYHGLLHFVRNDEYFERVRQFELHPVNSANFVKNPYCSKDIKK